MKQFFTLVLAGVCAVAAGATPLVAAHCGPVCGVADAKSVFQNRLRVNAPNKVSSEDYTDKPIITEAPQGTLRHYSSSSISTKNEFAVTTAQVDGVIADLTFTEDGKVYWLNPLASAPFGSYIVGEVKDDKITFQFPQHVYDQDYGFMVYEMYISMMESYVNDEGSKKYRPLENQTMTLNINSDGTLVQEGDGMMAFSDWDAFDDALYFDGFAEQHLVLTPFDAELVQAPADAKFESWVLSEDFNETGKWLVDVAIVGNDVYVKGFSQDRPDMMFKGTISGDKIVVPNGQYVGSAYFRYDFTMAGVVKYEYDPNYGREVGRVTPTGEDFVFNYDAAARKLTSPDKDCVLIFNEGNKDVSYLAIAVNPSIYHQGEIADPTPTGVIELKVENDWENYGQIGLRFVAPCENYDGLLLQPERMGYEVFVDGELFTFEAGTYPKLQQDFTEVPYTFSDNYDIQYISGTDYHYVYFYFNTMKMLAVRTVYTDEAGNKYRSGLKGIDTSFLGVEDVEVSKEAVSVDYYDLSGRSVASGAKGLLIKRTVYTDGTSSTEKVVVK